MLESSRETCSGIQLEVNEKILDSCNQLMKVGAFSVVFSKICCNFVKSYEHTHLHIVLMAVLSVELISVR